MSGHRKFSRLTENFSDVRQETITQKTDRIKVEMALSELQQAFQSGNFEKEEKAIQLLEKAKDIYEKLGDEELSKELTKTINSILERNSE